MGKDSPPPIDYAAQAQAQADANQQTAQYNNNANRVDQYTPLGSSTWTLKPGADPMNPKPGDYIQTVALSPEQQALYSAQNQASQTLAGGLNTAAGKAVDAMGQPFDISGLPQLQGAPGIVSTAQPGQGMQLTAPQLEALIKSVSTQGLPEIGGGYEQSRQQVVDALMSRIRPELDRSRSTLDTQLANRGIEVGSTAYGRSLDAQGRKENDALMGAVLAGGQEQSRLAALDMAARGQLFGEGLANAGLFNNASGQEFQAGLASGQFQNQAQGQQFTQQAAYDAMINSLLGRNAAFDNQARAQGISEEAYLRSLPLNELNALRSGSQVAMPTFNPYYSSGSSPAPIMDAALAQGQQNNAINAQNNATTNATIGATAALAGSTASYWLPALMALSDERAKEDLWYLGRHPVGVSRYGWKWRDGSGYGVGVIAQDLQEIMPEAVHVGPDGFLRVDYGMIGGR